MATIKFHFLDYLDIWSSIFLRGNGLQMHLLESFVKGVPRTHHADSMLRLSLAGSW